MATHNCIMGYTEGRAKVLGFIPCYYKEEDITCNGSFLNRFWNFYVLYTNNPLNYDYDHPRVKKIQHSSYRLHPYQCCYIIS